jgi:hypothetical protein
MAAPMLESHMICPLVYLCFAMLYPSLSHSRIALVNVPANLVGAIQVRKSKHGSTAAPAANSAEAAACRKFVGGFYAWYLAHGRSRDPLAAALRQKRASFSLALVRGLNEDARAAARSPSEIVGLDFDPVLNSQDFAERYSPGRVTQKGSRFLVDVFSVYVGKRSEEPAVTAELRRERGRWIFTNFLYRNEGKTDDLLSVLRRLKAERQASSPRVRR